MKRILKHGSGHLVKGIFSSIVAGTVGLDPRGRLAALNPNNDLLDAGVGHIDLA